jgi:hypothetical protein
MWQATIRSRSVLLAAVAYMCMCVASVGCSSDDESAPYLPAVHGTWLSPNERAFIEFTAECNCRAEGAWFADVGTAMVNAWHLPPAFVMGLISGETHLTACLNLSGSVSSFQVVDSQGHASLQGAAVAALGNFQSPGPLPACVGADSLVLDMRFKYRQMQLP